MMGGILTWLIIGLVLYLLLSKRGGMMGCCGGHNHHSQQHPGQSYSRFGPSREFQGEIIDLKKEDYSVQNKR